MFGYVKAYKPELKVRDYEIYKAVYCTLCKKLGKAYGPFARMTLSYDFTFLSILNSGLKSGCGGFEKRRCSFNPLKKCNYCKGSAEDFDMPAAAAMILLYFKIEDNIADSTGIKKILYKLIKPLFKRSRKKASKQYPEIDDIVNKYSAAQSEVELQNCGSVDKASEPTAIALADIFALCSNNQNEIRTLKRIGYCIGKWVYLTDAAADLEEDIKKQRYNPLKETYNAKEDNPLHYAKKRLEPTLNVCISEAAKAFDLLDIKKYRPILENVIYLGLENSQKQVFKKEKSE